MRTLSRTEASWIDKLQEVVVLPTPPLPPTNIHLRVVCLRTFWRVGSRLSESTKAAVDDIFLIGLN